MADTWRKLPPRPRPGTASASERVAFLLETRSALASSLELEASLTALAELIVSRFADWCAIDVVDGDALLRVVVAHADPAKRPILDALKGHYPLPAEVSQGPGWVLRTQRTQLVRKAEDPGVVAATGDEEHRAVLRELGVRSAICSPLLAHDRAVGALTVVRSEQEEAFTANDSAMVRSLGATAGVAVVHGLLYREVQEASRAKDEFMATLGHELRNPIGAIMAAVGVLERLGRPDDPAARPRAIIARQTRNLARLVDDLLDVARLTSGKITLQRRPVDLREIVERCLATTRLAGRAERHEVTLEAEPAPVSGDPTRLEQVVGNVLDNALQFTPAGGDVAITVGSNGGSAMVRVRDSGAGIAPDVLPRVFDLFTQGPQPLDRARGGLGLGLTLVRRLVELHGGTVEAASPGPGRGTTVTIRLPLEAVSGTPAVAPAATASAPRRILVIEDSVDTQEALRQLLELNGHHVQVAGGGTEGIALALATRPDLVLIDIGLPEMSGYEVAQELRGTPAGTKLKLVALTGYGQPSDRARAMAAGFDAHLVKPVDYDALAAILPGAAGHGR